MMMNFGIPSGAARRKAVMKPGTHKGKQEHVMSAKCEHSVKAQQEGTLASTWGTSWKERSRRKQKHNGLFCRPSLNETVKMIHTLLFHTHGQTVLTWRQMCSRGRWKHQAGEGKEPRRGAGVGVGGDSKSSRLKNDSVEWSLWFVLYLHYYECFHICVCQPWLRVAPTAQAAC